MKRGYRGVRVQGDEPRAREVPRAGSHRRRYSIPTDPPRATLQRSIRLLDRSDPHPITAEAFEAIAGTLPFGSVSFERD